MSYTPISLPQSVGELLKASCYGPDLSLI